MASPLLVALGAQLPDDECDVSGGNDCALPLGDQGDQVLGVPVVSYWNGDMANHMNQKSYTGIMITYYQHINLNLSHNLTYIYYILYICNIYIYIY